MALRPLRSHYRIVIPFVLIAIVIPAVTSLASLSLLIGSLEDRVAKQVLRTADAVSRGDMALNEAILDRVKDIAGTDVITFTTAGAVLATTFGPGMGAGVTAVVTASDATRELMSAAEGAAVVRRLVCDGIPCYVAYRRVSNRTDGIVALILDITELTAATSAVRRDTFLSAGLGLIVMVIASQLVTRRVTGPLERLVAFTKEVLPGGSRQRAKVGKDEIGHLAAAFNQMLDRLDDSRDALVRSEKLAVTGLLAARVAHDVRNPLSSVRMKAQLMLQSGMREEQAKPLLEAMLNDIDRIESVVRDLLELARPGELDLASTRLNDSVSAVLQQLALQLKHRKIVVATDYARSLPPIPLDANRFRQALLNVIVNAADAMPHGGTLRVATRDIDAGCTQVLEIADDGVGVPPEVLDQVFHPFFSTKSEGIGLGLVNAKSVIDGHGGRIAVAPRQPKGTCVTICLPVGEPTPASEAGVVHG